MRGQETLYSFSPIGLADPARQFPGFVSPHRPISKHVHPRDAVHWFLDTDDMLAIEAPLPGIDLFALVFGPDGRLTPSLLGLPGNDTLSCETFDSAPLSGWMQGHGLEPLDTLNATALPTHQEPLILKAVGPCDVWLIQTVTPANHVFQAAEAPVSVTIKRVPKKGPILPDPQGAIRDEFTVTSGTAQAYQLQKGDVVQIIDVEGQQCSDFTAFNAHALDRGQELMIDGTATRSMVRRAFPGPGLFDKFYDLSLTPLLKVEQDTCGRHDTFGLACTARGYEERGFPGHVNCSDNMSGAGATFGIRKRTAWPAINFFWNTWIDPHSQHLQTAESHSRPGDFITMRALTDLVCLSTACPDDIDPINGWNPTDVHVRIYKPDTPIQRAIAYREKEDAPMQISQESAFHPRTGPLTDQFSPARDLWTPVAFPSVGTLGEYWACREAVTLQDMSGLRKFDIIGPDAEKLLNLAITRDVTRLAVWRGTYALMCDAAGTVIDDGTLFRLSPDLFRWCCGTEESARALTTLAADHQFNVRVHAMAGTLPNLALQGPKSRDVLKEICFTQPHVPSVDQLKWFGVTVARLNDRNGVPFMVSRTGYTGELGYELFCTRSDAVALWDAVMEAGRAHGIVPMGSAALDTIRIEAGLAAANQEFAPGVDALEAGLGFAVDFRKSEFIGRDALLRNSESPRVIMRGLKLGGDEVPAHGAHVYLNERPVGVVTSATRSPMLKTAIAMARISVEHADIGTALEIGQLDGHMKRLAATVCDVPFVDPTRSRARA